MVKFDNPSPAPHLLHRRRWLIAAALALLALIYSGVWFTLAMLSRDGVVQWIERQRESGFAVRYDSLTVTGFPLAIRLEFTNPGFGAPGTDQPWGWEGAGLALVIKPWDRESFRALVTGQQMLAFTIAGRNETYVGEVASGDVTIALADGDLENARVSLNGVDLKSRSPRLQPIRTLRADISLNRLASAPSDHQAAAWRLRAAARGVALPWLRASPLGGEVQSLTFDGRLMGRLDAGPIIESLEDWRDGGGTFELEKLAVRHGPLKIKTDGTLALDGDLQLIGALTARVEGFFETVDALQKLGLVKARDAVTAKMVLGVLSRRPSNGGPATLNLALTAQNNRLYAGPVKLLALPKIDWRAIGR